MLQHEKASVDMLGDLVRVNNLRRVMRHHGLVLPVDLVFIKELMDPKDPMSAVAKISCLGLQVAE